MPPQEGSWKDGSCLETFAQPPRSHYWHIHTGVSDDGTVYWPLLYEGFGMPLLEATACGAPVVTSNVTSMPEIAGDAAFLINPNNGEELKAAVMKLLNDENLRNNLIARGLKQAKEYSWVKMAKKTLAIYESVYKA